MSSSRLKTTRLAASLLYVCCITPLCVSAVAAAERQLDEQQWIAMIETNRSPREADAACAALKRVGTAACVPTLARLLPDVQLSHSARYVLESLSAPEAGAALISALPRATGEVQAGIIHSLQVRRETAAVSALSGLLLAREESIANAAAQALGTIGSAEAVEALQSAVRTASGTRRVALAEALLNSAEAVQAVGDEASALTILRQLSGGDWPERIRVAAYRGILSASGQDGLNSLAKALTGPSGPAQTAALGVVPVIDQPDATTVLAQALRDASPAVQGALATGLGQRGDPAAAPAIVALLSSPAIDVRLAALNALTRLGDAGHVWQISEIAASASGVEQAAARLTLSLLARGPVAGELVKLLQEGTPALQAEAARALGERRDVSATAALLSLAGSAPGPTATAALQALGVLSGREHLEALVGLVAKAETQERRAQAGEVLATATHRILVTHGRVDVRPLLQGLNTGTPETRAALLRIASGIIDPEVRQALRTAAGSEDSQVRSAAIAAMSDSVDPELLPDLVRFSIEGKDTQARYQAIAGVVRLWAQEEPVRVNTPAKMHSARTLAAAKLSDDQWRKLLAGLAEIPDPEILAIVQTQANSPAVRNEAARAVIRICTALPQTETARRALTGLDIAALDSLTRNAVQTALAEVGSRLAFITSWQAAGPYRQTGKNYSDLFDTRFPPEVAPHPGDWKTAPLSGDGSKPYTVDLLKLFGGEQCVAYARAALQSEAALDCVFEIGSDDGIKLWLNGELVHANNTARPLQPGQDKARGRLKAGRNDLLLKLTQNNAGWEFCVKMVDPEGRLLPGTQVTDPQ